MNYKNIKKIKIGPYEFLPFEEILKQEMKNPAFKKAYDEEGRRLALIGEIRDLRKKKKLTQKKLAAKARMPQSVIARIESGNHRFSIATLDKIARVFHKRIGLV